MNFIVAKNQHWRYFSNAGSFESLDDTHDRIT